MRFENLKYVAESYTQSHIDCPDAVATGCRHGVTTQNGSANFARFDFTGVDGDRGNVVTARAASYINVYGATIGVANYALYASDGGHIYADTASVDDAAYGCLADGNGTISAGWDGTEGGRVTVSNCTSYGFYAASGGVIKASQSRADACGTGYGAQDAGRVIAANSGATNCTNFGYFVSYMSFVKAEGSAANTSGNSTDYSEASSVLSATGGMIFHN